MISINLLNFSKNCQSVNKNASKSKDTPQKHINTLPKAYPKSYYMLSFSGGRKLLSLEEQAERLNLDALPNRVSNKITEEIMAKSGKNLYDIHTEIYSPLLECKTLDDAKALYPEFEDVIDAAALEEDQMSPTLKHIKDGKIEDADIKNLSLLLLQTHYAKGISPNARGAFFGLSKDAMYKIFEKLNIKRLDGQYLRLVGDCSPQKRQRMSEARTPEMRAKLSKRAREIWSDENKRAEQSKNRKAYFEAHPEAIRAISERMAGTTLSPDVKAKISKSEREYYKNHPEEAMLRSAAWKEHSDITKTMKKIARDEFPYLKKIILKQQSGKGLTENEKQYLERYHKRCETLYPGMHKKVGETFKRLRKEFKEKNDGEN